MRTRRSNYPNNSNVTIPRRRRKQVSNIVEPEIRTIVTPMAERTMEELLRAPTEGYGEAIVLPEINADHFEIKTNLLQLVQANPFYGRESENPHAHINSFKRITSTLRFRNVPNDVIKLMMFPYSLEGAAKTWYEKEPPNSILTWEDLVTKFVNQFFPPSKTTHLKNEISRFTQKFEETFSEAWERFKELLRACPHHGFTELTQVDTFTMVRNSRNKAVVAKVSSNSSTPKISPDVAALTTEVSELKNMMKTMLIDKQKAQAPAPVKAVEKSCVTYGGAHSYRNCPATDGNVNRDHIQEYVSQAATANFNQRNTNPRPPIRVSNQIAPPGFAPVQNNGQNSYMKANESIVRNMQGQINEIRSTLTKQEENRRKILNNDMRSILESFFQNQASTLGTLPSNTIPNPKGEMKAITTRSGVAYEGPSIPTNHSPKKVVERETEETTNKEQTNFQGSTAQISPPVIPISIPEPDVPTNLPKTTPILEPDIPKSLPKPDIPYPSRRDNQKFAPTIKSLLMNKEKLLELAKISLNENCSTMLLKNLPEKLGDPDKFLILCNFPGMDVCHALADLGASINLIPLSIWKNLSLPDLTPTQMTLELADRSITRPRGLAEDIFVKVRNFHFPTDFVVVDFEADPRVPLILGRSFLRTSRALIDVYEGELVLRDGNEQITFHVNGTSKHPQKHENESIKMVNDACKDSFKRFTDEPTQVCPPPSEDVNNKKENQAISIRQDLES
ncbi:reverse transcriptase domain-containing protein [Tanacetum coccineum]